jgi:hypothetical protein
MSGYSDTDNLDDFGRRIRDLFTAVVGETPEPLDWEMGPQTAEIPHARVLMRVNGRKPWFQIPQEESWQSDEQIKDRMRGHIRLARQKKKP